MPAIPALILALQAILVQPESGEVHLRHVRQLTFGGQNANGKVPHETDIFVAGWVDGGAR